MQNTEGTSPLQALVLSDCFDGKTDQEILEIIANHLTFTQEAGASIQGAVGPQGPSGPTGAPGANGTNGVTPTQLIQSFNHDADGFSDGITEFDIPIPYNDVLRSEVKLFFNNVGAPPANIGITNFQDIGTAVRVFFSAAISGDEWVLHVVTWS